MIGDPAALARSALTAVVGQDHEARRPLDQMTIAELESKARMNEERLRLARQLGWFGGFGVGVVGCIGLSKLVR
jgi:hypothetical protein